MTESKMFIFCPLKFCIDKIVQSFEDQKRKLFLQVVKFTRVEPQG
jgi:hypothetical protein